MNRGIRFGALLGLTLAAGVMSGCVMNRLSEKPQTITLNPTVQGLPLRLELEPGREWSQRMQAGPFIFNILPQIVIWAEDDQGRFLDTVYITGAGAKGSRHAAKKQKGAAFYRECFPVWASRLQAAGGTLPGPGNPYPDALTSATPSAAFTLLTSLPFSRESFSLYLEINKSNDTNDVYTKQNNDWAGQPSLIYRAVIAQPRSGDSCTMELIGHGGRIGEAPAIHSDLSGVTTALEQVRQIRVSFEG
jgi:hypothetical protein